MNDTKILTITSLMSVLLFSIHISDDIVRGIEPGTLSTYRGALLLVAWVYGAVMLGGRRSGAIITLAGGILGTGASVSHMTGAGLMGGRIANSSGTLLWTWTLFALGITAAFSIILSARALWRLRRGQPT